MTNFSAIFSYGLIDRQHASFSRDKRWKFFLYCVNVISTLKKRVSMTFLSVTQQIWMCWHWKRTKKWRSRIVLPVNRDHKPPLSTNLERNHHKTMKFARKYPINIVKKQISARFARDRVIPMAGWNLFHSFCVHPRWPEEFSSLRTW